MLLGVVAGERTNTLFIGQADAIAIFTRRTLTVTSAPRPRLIVRRIEDVPQARYRACLLFNYAMKDG